MKWSISCLITACFAVAILAEKARFDNYKVYNLAIETETQLQIVIQLTEHRDGYELWQSPILGRTVDIVVPPHKFGDFADLLENVQIKSTLKITNLQDVVDNEQPKIRPKAVFGWEYYHTLDEIYAWLDIQLSNYSNVLTSELVGHSYQGKPIRAVKLSHKPGNPAIMIESNIHAREWITSATATWVLNELLTSTDKDVRDMAENIDWYIVPVLNVDGFEYTKTTNRMWRKTRYPHSHLCYGVDGNRNFDFHWMHVGASQNPCDITYAGPRPFSEPETRAVADFYIARKNNIKVYLAFHSYGQFILLPFGWTEEPAENAFELMQIGNATAAGIYQKFNTSYTVGSTADVLYMNSGSSRDWVKGVHNINVSYTIEFRDKGTHGFVLPADQIIPNALEIFDGLKSLVAKCREIGYL